ncbi:exodeoxyribonuclease III [Chondromyces crocatus]|uniref:Exodeoxyribonuclease III n=1 Tax=Chondromyces crocatus TaxID=52 RepID=A0A0K1EFM2_CHOCO|nr:exodeoxyribonuclease III [Chondromyces crocatus]AKT39639.1 exodeoxyribonuclease III [Chondromyces crocatus]
MKLLSWNVNGLRSCWSKGEARADPVAKRQEPERVTGFKTWLSRSRASVVGLQEVRAREDQLDECLKGLGRWHRAFSAATRPGYSGVALFSRTKPEEVLTSLGEASFDDEGRFQLARFGRLLVVNAYFPNGNGKDRDLSRVPYKLAFYQRVFDLLEHEKARGVPIVVMGDFNTAHREIDLARPKDNVKNSGFTTVEREEFDRWIRQGWIDTFRVFEPGPDHYTWWSQRFGVRARNIGWRIDYVLVSPAARPFLRSAFIQRNVEGSDHCPVGIELDDSVTGMSTTSTSSPRADLGDRL